MGRHKKDSNYLTGSNSTYWNVCQFTETLQSTAYSIWSNSTFYNVSSQNIGGGPNFKLAVSRISKFINNSTIHEIVDCIFINSSTIQEIVDCIFKFIYNHSSIIHEILNYEIQWPPEKVATMWTVANSN